MWINNIKNKFKKRIGSTDKKIIVIMILTLVVFTISALFLVFSERFYSEKTLAKIISIDEKKSEITTDQGKKETIINQNIKAEILNGVYKGKIIDLNNNVSFSQVVDVHFSINDKIFVDIYQKDNKISSVKIGELKRDNYIVYISIIFLFLILIIGGVKGFKSLISLCINIITFSMAIILFSKGYSLVLVFVIASVMFSVMSILIVCGISRKTISAILGTLLSTAITMIIAWTVIYFNNWSGVHFEEMEFLTHPPEKIFLMEIMVGTLGAIMDIAITISSSIYEIYINTPQVDNKRLTSSAMEIGKDIMGTMANTLMLAYMSGSIPMIVLLLRNGFPISYIFSINMSLDIIRALTGSIGIVLSIPITIYITIIVLRKGSAT